MKISTKRCHEFGHPEFVLEVDDDRGLEDFLKPFAKTLQEMVAAGSVFKPSQTLQRGWMMLQVQEYDASRLTLFEPDMESLPVEFTRGVTETLRQEMRQVFTLDSLGLERSQLTFPAMHDTAIVCDRFAATADLYFSRSELDADDPRDSGWFLGCLDDDHDHNDAEHLALTTLYEAALTRSEILMWLAMPMDTVIALEENEWPVVLLGDDQLEIVDGSYLGRLFGDD